MTKIIESIRERMSLSKDDDSFDPELLNYTNDALSVVMNVIDLEENKEIKLVDATTQNLEWKDLFPSTFEPGLIELIKHFIYLKTKLLFDPPSPTTQQYIQESINETLFRIQKWEV